ncbi:unnamed protein product [Strongylus vulgaris]|uniref:Cytochrome P450 n=1 Tax=Strongylus vulgaris TaxID=40348 RepID=A0A3P7LBM4_STRVU|nr:unnamed protein product [Strongylus vulgaris]
MLLLVALFLISALAVYLWIFYENVKRYPKGPTPVPIFGNLLSANVRKMHEQLSDYAKVYGDVYTVWLPRPFVVITDYELIKEAFSKKGDDFSGRQGGFPGNLFQMVENGGDDFSGRQGGFPGNLFQMVENGGVVQSEGDNWKEQRRTSLHILRDFGMGKNLMEEQVLLSAQEFLAHMASIKDKEAMDLRQPIQGDNWKEQRRTSLHILRDFGMGKNLMEEQVLLSAQEFLTHMASIKDKEAMDLRQPIQIFIANIINKTLYGFSYDYNESDRLMKTVDQITEFLDEAKKSKLLLFTHMFPFLHHLPIIGYLAKDRFEKMMELVSSFILWINTFKKYEVKDTVREDVKRCLETYTIDQEPECFVHAYYQRMQTNSNLE